MKSSVIVILTASVALLLAVFLWKTNSPPAGERLPHSLPVAAIDVERVNQQQWAGRDERMLAESLFDDAAMDLEPTDELPSSELATLESIEGPPESAVEARDVKIRPSDSQKTPGERLTLDQTATTDTSLRNADFPRTYISSIRVDLKSPNHWVKLTWAGPDAASQETGPFRSCPGRGLGNNDCDDVDESNRDGSNCTPKGTMQVQGFSDLMPMYSHCRFVTWFQIARGIAFHYYPQVPNYPASHGCVRLNAHAAQLIHNNAKIGATEVIVDGKWTFVR